ncbi:MAG TPA: universal stress protein [Thermoanaerobaculia bacterium]|nr:universal stress protein [Thermoanaerobaculia bacterium]
MMLVERILVPIDFSPESLQGVEIARTLAAQTGAALRFVTVLEVGDLRAALAAHLSGFHTDEEVHRALERWVEENYARIDTSGATREIRRGIAEREILDAIAELAPQIVVMGSAGLARRLPLGSTTDYVLRHSAVPVLVVKAQ